LLVILSHSPELVDGNRSRELLSRAFGTLSFGELAVDGFFLISGYLIIGSWQSSASALSYAGKRIRRIYPGFLAASMVSILLVAPFAGATLSPVLLAKSVGRALALMKPLLPGTFPSLHYRDLNGSLWTIVYEARCYLLVAILGVCGLFSRPKLYLALTAALLLALVASPALGRWAPRVATFVGEPSDDLRFITIFLVGGAFWMLRGQLGYSMKRALLATMCLALLMPYPALANPATAVFGGYALFCCAFALHSRPLSRVGRRVDLSYGVYLYAWPIQQLLIQADRSINPWLLAVVTTLLACGMAWLSWTLVERPAMRGWAVKPQVLPA
jgi:peptidoglycan/LPS O-acetylase OafA/YrhL